MDGWKRWVRLGVVLVLVLVLYFVVPVSFELSTSDVAHALISLVALGLVTLAVVSQVRLQLQEPARRIDGLVVALLISVLAFALGFYVLEMRSPGQINGLETRVDSLYYTMATLLTIGYGDVHAVGRPPGSWC